MAAAIDDVLWRLLQTECGLTDQHVEMAKRLKVVPENLAEFDHEQLKLNLKPWLELAYGKTLGDDRSKSIIAN